MPTKKKYSKYKIDTSSAGVKQRTCKDYITGETIVFDSKLEKRYYDEIIIQGMKDGSILKYKLQGKYNLTPSFKYQGKAIREINYISDFEIWYADGRFVVVDTKGLASADAKIKKKLMHFYYPDINFIWVAHTVATGWLEYDELQKIRRENKRAKSKI